MKLLAWRLMRFDLTLLVRPSIGEALADNAFGRDLGAHEIVVTERSARVVAEVVFRQIAVKVLLAAMLVDALHAALEDREITLDRVRGDGAAHVFLGGVVDRFVASEILVEAAMPTRFIGHDGGFALN